MAKAVKQEMSLESSELKYFDFFNNVFMHQSSANDMSVQYESGG